MLLAARLLGCISLAARAADGQQVRALGGRSEIFAGSELETYLRYLQLVGAGAPYPWSVRSFSPREVDAILAPDRPHPWAARYALGAAGAERRDGVRMDWVSPTAQARLNSTFPYGSNDGPVWSGRGLTLAAQGGVAVRWRALSATVAPVAFVTQNASFELQDNGLPGELRFADGRMPLQVDRPQRFGSGVYGRLDPGQSGIRADTRWVAAGLSSANQTWGPGDRYPLMLGNNAPGFLHLFAGTGEPVSLGVARVHARVMWGALEQSTWSSVRGPRHFESAARPGTRRFASGLVAVVMPRGLRGLELGGARFFHSPWRRGGPNGRDLRKPLEGLFKSGLTGDELAIDPYTDYDNQLASLFGRWLLARARFELFAEYYREDHSWDLRDFLNEPEHGAGYLLGARKAFVRGDSSFVALRAEIANQEARPQAQQRPEGLIYVHGYLRQGHTHRGQLLGADIGVGSAAAASVGVDAYTPRGRRSITWTRNLRQVSSPTMDSQGLLWRAGQEYPKALDVVHALSGELVRFRGATDLTAGVAAVVNFNRDFAHDRMQAALWTSVRRRF
jgi:hypothetical protein